MPLGFKANAVRAYRPVTVEGRQRQLDRQIRTTAERMASELNAMRNRLQRRKPQLDRMKARVERMGAKALERRLSSNKLDRQLAAVELGVAGSRAGARAIQRRMQRAADAAGRGSQPAARARVIYANQLAFTGAGKPSKGAKNNLRPGPSNTNPPRGPRKRRRGKP